MLSVVIVCLALQGCAQWYEPPAGGPLATMNFEVKELPTGARVVGAIGKEGDDLCTNGRAQLATESNTNIPIAAGRPVQFTHGYLMQGGFASLQCTIAYTFIPAEGATYVGEVTAIPGGCTLAVFETTGVRRKVPWQRACKQNKR
jgi:hypothetical protein